MPDDVMRVYEIDFDVTHYQALLIDGDSDFSGPFFEVLDFDSCRPIDGWIPPPVYVDRPNLDRPNIFYLVGMTGMVLDDRALTELELFVGRAGQVLPLPYDGDVLHVLNVTELINCLDEQRSVFNGAGVAEVLAFHQHRLSETPIFRIPQNNRSQLFCQEGVAEPMWSFKGAVESAGLTGLEFEEVWNSEDGGIERVPKYLRGI